MATGNEILSYQGNPNLAFGSTALPAGSNDAIVDTSPAIKYWEQYAQNKLAVAKEKADAVAKKQLKTQEDLQAALDAGKLKFWFKDNAYATKAWNDFSKLAVEVGRKGNWENLNDPDYLKAKAMLDDIQQQAVYSMQQEAHHTVGDSEFRKNPHDYLPETQQSLDAYANAKSPKERAALDYSLDPKVGFNLIPYQKLLQDRFIADNPNVEQTSDQYGFVHFNFPKGQQPNFSGVEELAKSYYPSDVDAQAFIPDVNQFTDWSRGLVHLDPETTKGINWNPLYTSDAKKPPLPEYQPNLIISTTMYDNDGKQVESKAFQTAGGWNLAGTGTSPNNINVKAPTLSINPFTGREDTEWMVEEDANGNKHYKENAMKYTGSWTIDVITPFDGYYDPKTNKIYDGSTLSEKQKLEYEKERLVVVNWTGSDGKTRTRWIPYTEDVRSGLINSNRPAPPLTGTEITNPRDANAQQPEKSKSKPTFTVAQIRAAHKKELAGYSDQEIIDAYSQDYNVTK